MSLRAKGGVAAPDVAVADQPAEAGGRPLMKSDALTVDVIPIVDFRLVTPVYFVATKMEAFHGRGSNGNEPRS